MLRPFYLDSDLYDLKLFYSNEIQITMNMILITDIN